MRSSRSKVKYALYTISALFVLGFGVFAFRGLIFPPIVTLTNIRDGMVVPSGVVRLEGTTKRVQNLFVQGRQITRSPSGDFVLEVAVFPPYTIIEIEAKDKFNKTIRQHIQLSVE